MSTVQGDRSTVQTSEHVSGQSGLRAGRHYARDDFEFGSLLGIGALAQVVHVRDTYTEDEFALKILDKKQLRRVRISAVCFVAFRSLAKCLRS